MWHGLEKRMYLFFKLLIILCACCLWVDMEVVTDHVRLGVSYLFNLLGENCFFPWPVLASLRTDTHARTHTVY